MSFFFNDFFGGGGMPGAGFHSHHMGGDDSDEEEVDTQKFYDLLEIPKDATQEQIKKAYRKKARQLHPDRHPDEREKYQALFQEVQAANEILKDPQKRSLYDKYGEKGAKRGGGGRGRGGGLFEHMFDTGRSHGNDDRHKKSPQIKTALDVTLSDIYCGSTKKIKIHRRVATNDSSKCPRCKGQGQITQIQRMGPMVLQQRRECPQCGGIGYKLETQEHEIEVHVPVGGRHGENITIQDEGHQYPDMAPGDVIIQLRQLKHKLFERKGADLGMNYKLSLRQALCGYKIKIPHVSGKTLVITPSEPNEIVQPGSLKVVHTLGLPQRYSSHIKGHLYIVMEVEMPKSNTLNTNIIKQFDKILPIQQIEDDDKDNDDDDEEEDEKEKESRKQQQQQQQQNQQKQTPQTHNTKSQQTKRRQQQKKKGGKNRKNNKKKNGKKGNNKKKNKGGMFSGLQGAFGGEKNSKNGNSNNNKNNDNNVDKMDEDEDEDDMIEEVKGENVDGNPKATPASASNYYQDDDDDGDGVQCRQM